MDAPNPTQQKAADLTLARRRAKAFEAVFGQPARRNADQRLVVDHLRAMCGRDSAVFQPDAAGNFDPLRAAQKDGAQTQFLIIKRQLSIARKTTDEKPKVKVKRGQPDEQ